MDLSPRVLAAVEKYFSEPDRAEVKRLLSKYGDEVHQLEAERIHLVILRISQKDVQRVEALVNMAKRDYRDVIMAEAQPNRTYVVGLLRKGPNATESFTSLSLASLSGWKKTGAIVIGGRCLDQSELLGFYVFTVDSLEAAQALVSGDPAIQSGQLAFEFHPWLTADGLKVGVPKQFLDV